MFVTWKCECPEATWDRLLESPIRTVFDQLAIVPAQTITGPPQGRSWRSNKQATEPTDADSFCFYARVLAPHLAHVLQRSGKNGIYTIPKSEYTNLADARFSIVWLPGKENQDLQSKAEELGYAVGLVRSQKSKPTYGIRVWSKDYDRLWAAVKPGEPKPKHLPGEHLHKLTPVPVGATFEDVSRWVELENLKLRPLRALNATSWLLVGPERLEKRSLTWKNNAVMVQPVDSKYQSRNTVFLAGKKPSQEAQWRMPSNTTDMWKDFDPLTLNDPWAEAASTASSSTSRSWKSKVVARDSQIGKWFDKQYTPKQGSASQDHSQDLESMKSQISALESAVKNQSKDTSTLRKQVHEEIQEVRKELNTKVQDVKDSFQETLQGALHQTQAALQKGFKEDFEALKNLLGSAARKRPADQDDMQD